MSSAENYSPLVESNSLAPTPPAGDSVSNSHFPQFERTTTSEFAAKRKQILFGLAIAQIVASVVILVLACFSVGIKYEGPYRERPYAYNQLIPGIWVSLFSVFAGVMGAVAVKRRKARCLMAAYLVLCIMATILSVITVIDSSVHTATATRPVYKRQHYAPINGTGPLVPQIHHTELDRGYTWYGRAQLGLKLSMAILAFVHFACCNVSSGLICAIWSKTGCGGAQQAPTIIYLQASQLPDPEHNMVYVPMQSMKNGEQ